MVAKDGSDKELASGDPTLQNLLKLSSLLTENSLPQKGGAYFRLKGPFPGIQAMAAHLKLSEHGLLKDTTFDCGVLDWPGIGESRVNHKDVHPWLRHVAAVVFLPNSQSMRGCADPKYLASMIQALQLFDEVPRPLLVQVENCRSLHGDDLRKVKVEEHEARMQLRLNATFGALLGEASKHEENDANPHDEQGSESIDDGDHKQLSSVHEAITAHRRSSKTVAFVSTATLESAKRHKGELQQLRFVERLGPLLCEWVSSHIIPARMWEAVQRLADLATVQNELLKKVTPAHNSGKAGDSVLAHLAMLVVHPEPHGLPCVLQRLKKDEDSVQRARRRPPLVGLVRPSESLDMSPAKVLWPVLFKTELDLTSPTRSRPELSITGNVGQLAKLLVARIKELIGKRVRSTYIQTRVAKYVHQGGGGVELFRLVRSRASRRAPTTVAGTKVRSAPGFPGPWSERKKNVPKSY